MSGHNDYPEFEIENNEGKTVWTRLGYTLAFAADSQTDFVTVVSDKSTQLRVFNNRSDQLGKFIFERREFFSQPFELLLKTVGRNNAITHLKALVLFSI